MKLQPASYVEQFLVSHGESLSVYHAILDRAVPSAYAMWEGVFEDVNKVPGATLCADTRAHFLNLANQYVNKGRTLRLEKRSSSWHLIDGSDVSVRIRRYPKNAKTAKPIGIVPFLSHHLFGVDEELGYELAILWVPDSGTRSLKTAYLAAVSGLDDHDSPPSVYARMELPPPVLLNSSTLKGEELPRFEMPDDFNDEFPREDFGDDSLA